MTTKVLLISHGFQPSYEKAFTNAIAQRGIDVALAASVRTEFAKLDPRVNAPNILRSMDPARSIAQKIIAKAGYLKDLGCLVLRYRDSAVHLIGTYLTKSTSLGVIELLCYRMFSRRLILTVHNLLPHDLHTAANRRAAWLAYRIPHVLIVHTAKMREELIKQWAIAPDKVMVMEHGVDEIPTTSTPWKKRADGKLQVMMFGAVAPYKGVDIALRALAEFIDFPVKLALVGACRDAMYRKEIEALIAAIPALHQIEWINRYIPEESVQSYFEATDAVLLPYRHIDQSGVLFTAFRFGVPVIAFDVGAFAGYINTDNGVITPSNDTAGIHDGLRTLQTRLDSFDRTAIKQDAKQYLWVNTVVPILKAYA